MLEGEAHTFPRRTHENEYVLHWVVWKGRFH